MKKVLITAGPTFQYIDPVRVITNISSGKTGVEIADYLSKKFKITLLLSKAAKYKPKNSKIKIIEFTDFNSLNSTIKNELSNNKYDSVIHLAAVSDYSPYLLINKHGKKIKLPTKIKISSKDNFYLIKFKKNFKILDKLKKYSKNKNILIIGFKLTSSASRNDIKKAIKKLSSKWVVHNDTINMTETNHPFTIFYNSKQVKKVNNTKSLSKFFMEIIQKWRTNEHNS